MFRIYDCLTQDHDLGLVLVAAVVCVIASFNAVAMLTQAKQQTGRARAIWLAGSALISGIGIWATHFLAMLAYDIGLPTGFSLLPTLLSVALAIGIGGLGFALACQAEGSTDLWLGGGLVGLGIGAMHYTGMAGLELPALTSWDSGLVAGSLLTGTLLSALALRLAMARGAGVLGRRLGALILALAICGLHFAGMGALIVEPSPLVPIPDSQFATGWMATGVTLAASVILGISFVTVLAGSHWSALKERQERRLQRLVNATFEGIVFHADDVILDGNEALARMIGRPLESLIGARVSDFVAPEFRDLSRLHAMSDSEEPYEIEIVRADGARLPVEVLGRSMEFQGRTARVAALRDVSERLEAERRINYIANHDSLTGLPNRALFRDRLQQVLARARRTQESVAVLCIDIDRFKEVNDLNGHPAGDRLLQQVAVRLRQATREMDTVARLGGDDFAVILPGMARPQVITQLASRMIEILSAPYDVEGQSILSGASIGIAMFPQDSKEGDELLQQAELALYRAKSEGRGKCRLFEPEMDARMRARRHLERDLRRAIEEGGLHLNYQPQIDARDGSVVGFEALARWTHPERGPISPAEFIPLAEETGQIAALGEWVLRQACAEAARWPAGLRVGVNLSPLQFKEGGLPALVTKILSDSGLAPRRLELEITEGVLIDDQERAFGLLQDLKALGVRIAMDDFGTGYSSLSYLQRFPFDKIKIDQSFVRNLATSADAAAIVRAVIGLGRSLNVTVIAEGVETEAESNLLRREGCKELQGYLFGRPMPAEEVLPYLEGDARKAMIA